MNTLIPTRWPRMSLLSRSLTPELASLFEGAFSAHRDGPAAFVPVMNVWSDSESLQLAAELPGMGIDDIELAVHDGWLTLQGERTPEPGEGSTVHLRERPRGRFERRLQLPFDVQADQIQASLRHGVLTVRLPRAEASRPRRIPVTAAD